jgi:hypothetical protein
VLATWFVGDGDQVASGQLLGEVTVEKVSRGRYWPRRPGEYACWSRKTRLPGKA